MRRARLILAAAILVAATACGLVAGIGSEYRTAGAEGGGAQPRDAGTTDADAPQPPPEDCLDGIDDDNDGYLDCLDPKCIAAGYTCVDAPPQGWDGVTVNRHAPTDTVTPAACGDAAVAVVYFEGLAAAPTTCTACACTAADGGACRATVTCHGDTTCGGGAKPPTPLQLGPACSPQTTVAGANSCKVAGTSPEGGSCAADGGALAVPVPWTYRDDLCAAARGGGGKGCTGTQVCVNRGTRAPQIACLRARADLVCPAGWPATVSLYPKSGVVDQRGCGACTCGGVVGAGCSGATVTVNNKPDCTGGSNVSFSGCENSNALQVDIQAAQWGAFAKATWTPGSCPPGGGQPSGAWNPGSPEAFCCAQ